MKKIISIILSLVMVLSLALPAAAAASLGTSSTPAEKTELVAMRSEYSKTYKLPNGTYQYVAQTQPIHYKDSAGNFQEINNAITTAVKRDGYKFSNTANSWNAHFAEKLGTDNAVLMTQGEYSIAFSLAGQTGTAAVKKATELSTALDKAALSTYHQNLSRDNRAVIYSDVVQNVDIAYTVMTGALKEDIVIKSRLAPTTFKFRLTTNGLTIRESNGIIGLYTADGKEIFTFLPLYMEDANGKRSENVTLTYTSVKNGYELTVTADSAFLNDADTQYPVVLDPSLSVTGANKTYDAYIDQANETANYQTSPYLETGVDSNGKVKRTYICFPLNTDILPVQVVSASIYLKKCDYEDPNIVAHRIISNWSSDTITWSSVKPAYDYETHSAVATKSVGDWFELDITDITKDWLGYVFPNNGVIIKELTETFAGQRTRFYSSDSGAGNTPEFVINYNYYSSRPYQYTQRTDVNSIGYALEYVEELSLADLYIDEYQMHGMTIDQITLYIQENFETWLNINIGHINWSTVVSYNSNINENYFKVFCEIGFVKQGESENSNVFEAGDLFVHRWMYQTDTGRWAEKPQYQSSTLHSTLPGADPTTIEWESDGPIVQRFGMYYQIRDIQTVNW